jgi:hypothetical protein
VWVIRLVSVFKKFEVVFMWKRVFSIFTILLLVSSQILGGGGGGGKIVWVGRIRGVNFLI